MIQLFIYSESHDFNTTLVFHYIFKGFFFFFECMDFHPHLRVFLTEMPVKTKCSNKWSDKWSNKMIRYVIVRQNYQTKRSYKVIVKKIYIYKKKNDQIKWLDKVIVRKNKMKTNLGNFGERLQRDCTWSMRETSPILIGAALWRNQWHGMWWCPCRHTIVSASVSYLVFVHP